MTMTRHAFRCALAVTFGLAAAAEFDGRTAEAPKPQAWETRVLADIADVPGLPRVLLIGDSISMGYTLPVRELLAGRANVHRIPRNGGSTSAGIQSLQVWIGAGKWDVIHFNFGLHDLRWVEGVQPTTADRYEANLRALVARLQATGAKLIWASTTPVPGEVNPEPATLLRDREVLAYNERARRIMAEHAIPIDDLYRFALPRLGELQIPDNLHFTARGSEALAGEVARIILSVLDPKPKAPAGISPPARRPGTVSAATIASVRFEFVALAPGDFLMGSCHGAGDDQPLPMQLPLHRVQITRPFELGRTEVTQAQWQALMGDNPSRFRGPDLPVEQVSWEDARAFVARLEQAEPAHVYRLPTEAEWEYACRAGSTDDSPPAGGAAWYAANAEGRTHPVGRKQPNGWGLHDMRGNVWEWCQDAYDTGFYGDWVSADPQGPPAGRARIVRGGGIFDLAGLCRPAARFRVVPGARQSFVGLRIAREAR
jgi:acyl-CoA thioesterase-1